LGVVDPYQHLKYRSASLGLDSGEGALLHLFDREAICIEQRAECVTKADRRAVDKWTPTCNVKSGVQTEYVGT
jgi:hypothetical protein